MARESTTAGTRRFGPSQTRVVTSDVSRESLFGRQSSIDSWGLSAAGIYFINPDLPCPGIDFFEFGSGRHRPRRGPPGAAGSRGRRAGALTRRPAPPLPAARWHRERHHVGEQLPLTALFRRNAGRGTRRTLAAQLRPRRRHEVLREHVRTFPRWERAPVPQILQEVRRHLGECASWPTRNASGLAMWISAPRSSTPRRSCSVRCHSASGIDSSPSPSSVREPTVSLPWLGPRVRCPLPVRAESIVFGG